MYNLQLGDLIIIESKNRKNKYRYGEVSVSWTAKFLKYYGIECIQVEMLGNWFSNDPEIKCCELIFNLDQVNIKKI